MATTRNPLAGRYFNDPNIATGLSNLAAAFAPPSPEEYLIAEQVRGARTTNSALDDLYAMANGNPDILGGIVGGGWTPTQGFEAMRGGLANERRGQDITAETARLNNASDNERMLRLGVLDAAVNPEGRQAITDEDLMATIGLEGVPGFGMAGPVAPTDAQVMGQNMTRLQESGQLTDDMLVASVMSDTPVEMIDTPQGPQFQYRSDAVGQTAYVNQGGQAAPTPITYAGPDGTRLGGFILPTGQYVGADGKTPLTPQEAGTAAEVGKPVGTNDELGITGSIETDIGRLGGTITTSNLLIDSLESKIQQNAGAAGFAGTLQMLTQDAGQVLNELVETYGEPTDKLTLEEFVSLGAGETYDPVFREIRSGILQLAYLNAQRDNPRGEVSRFALERQLEALGTNGMLANDQSLLAALRMNREANLRAYEGAKAMAKQRGVYLGPGTGAPPAAPTAPPIAPGTVDSGYRFRGGDPADPNNWEPVQ